MKNDQFLGPLLFVAIAGLGLWWFLRQRQAAAAVAATPAHPPGTVVNPQPVQDPTLSQVEAAIPIIGPVVSPLINKAGSAIVKNQFLESHSQVGPNKGQTLASAGIAGVTFIPNGGIKWSTVGHDIKSGASTVGHYLNPFNW